MLRRSYLVIALSLLISCAKPFTYKPVVPEQRRVEEYKLPPDPSTMPLTSSEPEWIVPLEKGTCVNEKGILVTTDKPCPNYEGLAYSESAAERDGMYKISYREIRKLYEADRTVWGVERQAYESIINEQNKQIESLQPTWLEKNSLVIGFASGVFLTSLTTAIIITSVK